MSSSVQEQTNAYRRYAMMSFIKKDRYANEYVSSGREIDERLLQEFFDSSMRVRSRVAMCTFVKSLAKQSLVALKHSLQPTLHFLQYVTPENITPEISEEEYVLLLQDVQQPDTRPGRRKNVYWTIGQNMVLEMLNLNLDRLTELFAATGPHDSGTRFRTTDERVARDESIGGGAVGRKPETGDFDFVKNLSITEVVAAVEKEEEETPPPAAPAVVGEAEPAAGAPQHAPLEGERASSTTWFREEGEKVDGEDDDSSSSGGEYAMDVDDDDDDDAGDDDGVVAVADAEESVSNTSTPARHTPPPTLTVSVELDRRASVDAEAAVPEPFDAASLVVDGPPDADGPVSGLTVAAASTDDCDENDDARSSVTAPPTIDIAESIVPLNIFGVKRKRDDVTAADSAAAEHDDRDPDDPELKKPKMSLDDLLKSIKVKVKPSFVERRAPSMAYE